MFKNVKSYFILKYFFSFISDKRDLEIVKYYKNAQKRLEISITNYKLFAGKYIKLGKHGTGKEYSIYTNKIIFEGQYSNGKRNGKGKEYTKYGKLIFDGEYLNGKRNGKGKECNGSHDVLFSGLFKSNKRWEGEGYDSGDKFDWHSFMKNISPIYELKDGKGIYKQYSRFHNLLIEAEYNNGDLNGKGKEYYDDCQESVKYEGEFLNGKQWNGKGNDIKGNVIYELINGKGYVKQYDFYFADLVLIFEGEYINGEKNGKGKEYYEDGKL